MAQLIAKVFIIMTLVFEGIVILGMSTFIPVFATVCTVAALAAIIYHCYKDNIHSIWANQELYRPGNTSEEFEHILEKNMRPVYDSARRQGYELWKIS